MSTQPSEIQGMSVAKEDISSAIRGFLSKCSIPYRKVPMDLPFLELCYNEAAKRGYTVEGSDPLKPFIPAGVTIAITGYAHLRDTAVQVWMALYTACAIYCEDIHQKDTTAMAVFFERLMRGKPQDDRTLDAFADLILETSRHFPRITANFMVSSTLNFVNALLLEDQTQGLKFSIHASNYPAFSRIMSGVSELYALAIFPSMKTPLESFIQALPTLMVFIVNVNDILSFYKEELYGETVNQISLLALCRDRSKSHAFHSLIHETVEAHEKIIRILEPDREALDAYKEFARGYVEFHVSLDSRYRLNELEFQPVLSIL
ncbi:Trichodiene synthase-domain-containing protein [Lentinula lateritia]|uniref:Trichodiene synthase-domain-containing protein n=1 Tax=Lentinula aff. lateritia TaxID=2804960 RepID=A0ACC1U1V8_9AGAR|nr:Trichodiene synthase-domain-containing protein [Lentinula aff. lateritia]KAJ3847114.1 Trichodiene synthase-domain-containing protein [Lentinula lateritia]